MEHTLYDMIYNILNLIDLSESNFEHGDFKRTSTCTNSVSGKISMLRFLGIDYDYGDYDDNGTARVGYFRFYDHVMVKNGTINWGEFQKCAIELKKKKISITEIAE